MPSSVVPQWPKREVASQRSASARADKYGAPSAQLPLGEMQSTRVNSSSRGRYRRGRVRRRVLSSMASGLVILEALHGFVSAPIHQLLRVATLRGVNATVNY